MKRSPVVGIVGGGQLARMLILAGVPLGIKFRVLSEQAEEATRELAPQFTGSFSDAELQKRFADGVDCVTYEFENLPVAVLQSLGKNAPVFPTIIALETGQNRIAEKSLFQKLQIKTARFFECNSESDLTKAIDALGGKAIIKTTRLGYDGKGQARANSSADAAEIFKTLAPHPLIVEEIVQFSRELSQVATRSKTGEICFYPLTENVHEAGILRRSTAPAENLSSELSDTAQRYTRSILEHLKYVGTFALELFQVGQDLLANEMAPRVHNSGHWTIEGAATSQFENHLRAILGWPLGNVSVAGTVQMENIIGTEINPEKILGEPNVHLHWYGKTPRTGRKVGHITRVMRSSR